MRRNGRMCVVFLVALAMVLSASVARAGFVQVWRAGIDNNSNSEFVQENGSSNAPPGQPGVRDDDWYFAGTYPAPIGTLVSNDPNNTFERALTGGDPTDRIHFNLPIPATFGDSLLKIEIDTVSNNYTAAAGSTIPFDVYYNGVSVGSFVVNASSKFFATAPFTAASVGAVTGENVITLQRTNTGGWMQFDYIDLEVDPVPEPTTLSLLALGGVGLLARRRRR